MTKYSLNDLQNNELKQSLLKIIESKDYPFKVKRLAKAVSKSGFISARETEDLIIQGKIHVNGRKIDKNVPVSQNCDIVIEKDNKKYHIK